jgi:CHAD domain-containing protein
MDVQLAALRSLKMREPRRKTQLVNNLIELRARQEKKLRESVVKETVRDLRKRLKRARKDFDPKSSREPLTVARDMLEQIHRAAGPPTEAVLHEYRILSKRARYAAELAENSSEAAQFIAGLKRIQDAVGDWHDWLTLTKTASQHLGDVRESSLVSELHNVTGAKFRHAVSVLSQMRPKLVTDGKPPSQSPGRASTAVAENATSAA